MKDVREFPTAITGTWGDAERQAWYLYDNADEQSAEWQMAEAVLVLTGVVVRLKLLEAHTP